MKFKLIITCLIASLVLWNCKQEPKTPEVDYKYANNNELKDCKSKDSLLLNEALMSFEKDLINAYDPKTQSPNRSYVRFLSDVRVNKVNYIAITSKHTKELFEALKSKSDLWNTKEGDYTLNYANPLVACIASNMQEGDLKITFNALVDTNSMSYRMYSEELRRNTISITKDKYLALFVALDLYYAKLFAVDFNKQPEANIDFNKKPVKKEIESKDSHEGHNH